MDIRFSPHNTHLENPSNFHHTDPHLKQLQQLQLVHSFALLEEIPTQEAGVYTISGGRQIGKTTLLKQWMVKLMEQGVPADRIVYFSGELIDDHHTLVRLLGELTDQDTDGYLYLLLDEVSYIRDWDKGIKFLADSGKLNSVILVCTGSDTAIIKEARMRFPGRRGKAEKHDFHLYPLSFAEFFILKHQYSKSDLIFQVKKKQLSEDLKGLISLEFENYLIHGGYLTAMNDMALHDTILNSTINTYSDWIRGDFLKRGKQEDFLFQIIRAIIIRYGSQVTWNNLSADLTIDHPKTVSDYITLLQTMDAVFIQSALIEDKLLPAPKKAKKVIFTDPFIFHAMSNWIAPKKKPFEESIKPAVSNSKNVSKMVEAVAVSHYRRFYNTMYIKSSGEVDIAYIDRNRFWPIEVKWTIQIRQKDLKQIAKYPNSRILAKTDHVGDLNGIPVIPLPVALLEMELAV